MSSFFASFWDIERLLHLRFSPGLPDPFSFCVFFFYVSVFCLYPPILSHTRDHFLVILSFLQASLCNYLGAREERFFPVGFSSSSRCILGHKELEPTVASNFSSASAATPEAACRPRLTSETGVKSTPVLSNKCFKQAAVSRGYAPKSRPGRWLDLARKVGSPGQCQIGPSRRLSTSSKPFPRLRRSSLLKKCGWRDGS